MPRAAHAAAEHGVAGPSDESDSETARNRCSSETERDDHNEEQNSAASQPHDQRVNAGALEDVVGGGARRVVAAAALLLGQPARFGEIAGFERAWWAAIHGHCA